MQYTKYTILWARILFLMALLHCSRLSFAQNQSPLTEYTTENGLSLNSVNDLLFDKQGFLWVATADGLQRFDGYRFQTFKNDPQDKKSIPENAISEIYEDWNDNLWITSRTHITFKPKGKIEFIDLTSILPPFTYKYPLACVGETDSSVLVMNYPTGIFSINKINFTAKQIAAFSAFIDKDAILLLARHPLKNEKAWFRKGPGKEGDLYMVSADGLRQFRNNEKIIVHFLIQDKKDSLVIITDKVAYRAAAQSPFNPVRMLPSTFNATALDNAYMTWPRKIGNNQYLLIGTKEILLYDVKKEEIIPFPFAEHFSQDIIRYLQVTTSDSHLNNWLGYNGIGGIKVISPKKFGLFKRPDKAALPYSLATDDKGNSYAGIYLGDIEVYNKEGIYLKKIKLPEADKKFGSPRGMVMIDSSTLIIKSVIDRLYAVDINKGSVQSLSHLLPPNIDNSLGDFEFGMQKIKDGEIWLSYRTQIVSIQKINNSYSTKSICTVPGKERINSFFHNDKGELWIGTIAGAWYSYKGIFQKLPIPFSYVKNINQHPDGKIWVTTNEGIYVLKDTLVIKKMNTNDGLPNSFVYGVLFDDAGNSWVSTNRGLAKIDTAFQITTYSAKEGLQGDEFNTKGYCKGPDGTLFFAGVNGINFFKPENLVSKGEPSKTLLTGIEVNNQTYKPELQPEFISTISLPHSQNNIRLSFANMDLTVPERNQYKFRLKGFQNDWSLPQTNNIVQYILPPGEYELNVMGANYEGIWSKEPLVLKINILPPWYQTAWANFLFAILILGAVGSVFYFISRNRYQKKLRKLELEQEVQKEKQRLSRDLHDNLGSQLTWLSNTINQLERSQEEHQPTEKKLNQLKEGSSELMQTLRETIWIMNKEKISAVELFDKLVSHAARHIEAYPPLQLQTEENILDDLQLNSGQTLQMFRICQEAITNACKHAQATMLSINAFADDKQFSITISDNGKGFDLKPDGMEGHYGLQNMQERAKESNLVLNISSSPGKETAISVSLLQ